jgi:hypothetical protein
MMRWKEEGGTGLPFPQIIGKRRGSVLLVKIALGHIGMELVGERERKNVPKGMWKTWTNPGGPSP